MDGTLVDNMKYHGLAWQAFLHEQGMRWNLEKVKQEMYGTNVEMFERLFGDAFDELEVTRLAAYKEKKYRDMYRPHLKLCSGLTNVLDTFIEEEKGLLGIGTSAEHLNLDFVLDGLSIREYFHTIITAEEVEHGKPHPETYLKAAEKMGTAPENCIVFEDVPKGVDAGLNAGMKVVAITTTYPAKDLMHATRVIDSYHELRGNSESWFD